MPAPIPEAFREIYSRFERPITHQDCGKKCSPYNQGNVPFCCDTRHIVPSAYAAEWNYLRHNSKLWHPWEGDTQALTQHLQAQAPEGQTLIACLGHERCERNFRAIACRAFPFFPYLDSQESFLGLSVYWEYADRCWVINHLEVVSPEYREEFTATFELLFQGYPAEREAFRAFSAQMRTEFSRKHRAIPLLHRLGGLYKISPTSQRLRQWEAKAFPKHGPYQIAARLPFPDEVM